MNRIVLIIAISVLIVSCSSNDEKGSDAEKLDLYKEQVEKLNKKISDLEKSGISAEYKEYSGLKVPVKTQTLKPAAFCAHFCCNW